MGEAKEKYVSETLLKKFQFDARWIQSMVNGTVQASASLKYIDNPEKLQYIDYSLPVTVARTGMIFKPQPAAQSQSQVFRLPILFKHETLGGLFAICILMKIIVEISNYCNWKSTKIYGILLTCLTSFFTVRFYKSQLFSDTVKSP